MSPTSPSSLPAVPGGDLLRAVGETLPSTARAVLPSAGTLRWRPGRDARAVRHPGPRADVERAAAAPMDPHVVVVGGGIAGIAAAVGLAERGVRVTLVESCPQLGGRVRSWPVEVPAPAAGGPAGDGVTGAAPATTRMSRGFHAFFRQYYTLRALLRRVDPDLSALRPVEDYPLLHADGTRDSFTHIPRRPPFNMLGFVAMSPSFTAADLTRVDIERALALLDVDFPATFTQYDGVSARDVLDDLRFPDAMRHLALEVFARSFFADPADFSGGELVGMFHTYFLGSAEGLLFDVAADDFDSVLWAPLGAYLAGLGAEIRCETSVERLERDGTGVRAVTTGGEQIVADAVVLATHRPALQRIVAASPWLGDTPWREAVARAQMAPRFVVQRLWFDRPVSPETPVFLGTAAFGMLDNVSAFHLMEEGAAEWARRTGGSVIELHAYAVPDEVSDGEVRRDLLARLLDLHPELNDATVLHEEFLVEADCPLVGTDPWAARPGVRTPAAEVVLAGDGIRCEHPVALMERAATTGIQASNALLADWGREGHDLWTVPTSARFGSPTGAARRLAGLLTTGTTSRSGAPR